MSPISKKLAIVLCVICQSDSKKLQGLMELFLQLFNTFPKPKTAKIIKHLLDQGSRIEGDVSWQVDWCERLIKWCKDENRTFLRQRVELRLINLLWQLVKYLYFQKQYHLY